MKKSAKICVNLFVFCILPLPMCGAAVLDVNNVSLRGDSTLMGMKVESVYVSNGAFLVVTTGARYEYVPGELKVYQGLGSNKRLLSTISFDQNALFQKVADNNDHALFWSDKFNIGIYGNSMCMVGATVPMQMTVSSSIMGTDANAAGGFVFADSLGGATIHTASPGDSSKSTKNKTVVTYNLKKGEQTTITVSGPWVFVAPVYKKILQQNVNATGNTDANLICAKNETVSFQIIVAAKGVSAITGVDLAALEWQGPAGASKFPNLVLFREHYVSVAKPSYGLNTKVGMYPDALIPFVNPYTGQTITTAKYLARNQTISAGNVQGYWADVNIASDVMAGTYTTTIQVTSGSTTIAQVPVTIHVYGFVLPQNLKLKAFFCGLRDICSVHNVTAGSDAYWQITRRYQEMLYANGIYPPVQNWPAIDYTTGNVNFTPDFVKYLKDFTTEFGPMYIQIATSFDGGQQLDQDRLKLAKYIASYEAFSKANPWAGTFFCYIDEPSSVNDYQRVKAWGDTIRQYAPSVKFLVTFASIPGSALPPVDDLVDIKVLLFNIISTANLNRYRPNSAELWAYTALTLPGNPHWLTDSNSFDYRIPVWCCYRLGITGILYWQTMNWATTNKSSNPWVQSVTYTNGDGLEWNGEGSLLYPGTDAGIDGPIASIRLKVFRDSAEDFKYFAMLDSLAGAAQTLAIVSPIVSDFQHYSNNPETYLTARKQIAELIQAKSK